MPRPLVIAYHLIWTAYAHWLPNDPRGSGTKVVASANLASLGELHLGRRRIQPAGWEVRTFYEKANELMKFPVAEFGRDEIDSVANAFAEVILTHQYTCYACAIMPDHVHLLIRKHKHLAEEMIENFQAVSRLKLGERDFGGYCHPIWTEGGWKVYLDHPDEIRRTIRYIDNNPAENQSWDFVKVYDGWPLHPGHNPNSPWARRLRGSS